MDAWTSAYLASVFPGLILWAPTQRARPDVDFLVRPTVTGKLFILEDKAAYMDVARGEHVSPIGTRQLYNYLVSPFTRDRTFYVLPVPPYAITDVPASPVTTKLATARLSGHAWGGQPFEEWTFVVAAKDLWLALYGALPAVLSWPLPKRSAPVPPGVSIPPPEESLVFEADLAKGGRLEATSSTLSTFVRRVKACDLKDHLGFGPGIPLLRVPDAEYYQADDVAGLISVSSHALAAIVPVADLPGWKSR